MTGGELVNLVGGLVVSGGLVVTGGLVVAAAATSMVIVAPAWALEPGLGLMLYTVPGVVPAGALPVTWLTWKPLLSSSCVASATVLPITLGTLEPPSDTDRVTWVPGATWVPPGGLCETTWPEGSVLCTSFTLELRPALASADTAAASCLPVRSGTVFLAAPADTNRSTAEWAFTFVPLDGSVEITSPDATVEEARSVTVPTTRLLCTILALAWARLRPSTAGTEMLPPLPETNL